MKQKSTILHVRNLKAHFFTDKGVVRAVDGIDFDLKKKETLAIVGESGSGKSVTALSILRLIPYPGRVIESKIEFRGKSLIECSETEMQRIRGNSISMIFQEPLSSLNPVFRVRDQIIEVLRKHRKIAKRQALERGVELLRMVGIPSPEKRIFDYPHQMSGGMRQRVMIATAIACEPEIIIADEPTTALDVTIQAQILHLMEELKNRLESSILLITHNLGIVAEIADTILVMYLGKVMERCDVNRLFSSPLHPYTKALLNCVPRIDAEVEKGKRIPAIGGTVPSAMWTQDRCRFSTRCEVSFDRCFEKEPPLTRINEKHEVRCWKYC